MKLFVTGAAGFIGSNYVRHVLAWNTADVAGTRGIEKFAEPTLRIPLLDPLDSRHHRSFLVMLILSE